MSETRCPFAVWRGPIPNMTVGGQHRPARGLVLHVEVGTEAGTDSWFHNPAAKASADFGCAKDGTLHQWVDLADKAWAQAFYNPDWYSVETEGTPDEPLTDAQVASCGRLFAWLAEQDGFPLQVIDDPNGQGLITHGDLGPQGGGHIGCPGDLRAAQRPAIVAAALGGTPAPTPAPTPTEDDLVAKLMRTPDGKVWCVSAAGRWHIQDAAQELPLVEWNIIKGTDQAQVTPDQLAGFMLIPEIKV